MGYLNLIFLLLMYTSTKEKCLYKLQANINDLLIESVENKDVDKSLKLLEKGANPRVYFSYEVPVSVDEFTTQKKPLLFSVVGWTPPLVGCYESVMRRLRCPVNPNTTLIQQFLDMGAGDALSQKEWDSLLGFAANHCTIQVVSLLLKSYSGKHSVLDHNYLFAEAIRNLRPDTANMVIGPGIKVNAKNEQGATLLIAVARATEFFPDDDRKKLDAARLLLKHGADVNAQDKAGMTALMWAVIYRKVELVRILLEHGANPNLTEKGNSIPILGADCVSLLPKSEKGRTAVDFAKGNTSLLEMLKQKTSASLSQKP